VGPAGFEPAASSARGWHPTKLDNGPSQLKYCVEEVYEILVVYYLISYLFFMLTSNRCICCPMQKTIEYEHAMLDLISSLKPSTRNTFITQLIEKV
jgi:hypothetical protein